MAITLISSAGTTPSIGENTTAITTLSALGADPALLTYTIIGGADQALFALDPSTHALTFIGAPNFEAPGDADANNVYDVVVRVAIDAGTNTTQTLAITITDSNDAPVFTSANTASISENATGTLVTLAATDADAGQTLSYAISGGADAALFALDPATNALSFIAPPDFEAHADADGDNVYHVTVEASDGAGGTSTQDIAITVTNIGGVLLNGTNGGNTIDATHAGVGGGMPTGEEDIINGKAGNDVLSGLGGNDQINGDAGNDMLNGGLGADSLAGGLGNDTYIVGEALDTVTELGGVGSGFDLIRTTLTTFSLAAIANVENLAFIGTGGFIATGNGLANKLTGGAGNDYFVGGAGNDTLTGGLGDDTYVVADTHDTIVEGTAGGTDTVETALSTFTIAAISNVENLSYTGSGDFTGIGNGFSNLLQGGEGSDHSRVPTSHGFATAFFPAKMLLKKL